MGVREDDTEQRPPLTPALTGTELRRWYWLATELASLARALGMSPRGPKQQLTARLAAALDGHPPGPRLPLATRSGRAAPVAGQLQGELTADTVIPAGQRCSQALRRFFTAELGPSFRFDAPMREFIASGQGRTLAEAVDHWRGTRQRERGDIAVQFELNRFLRDWYAEHPGGHRDEALNAWRTHRSRPVEGRNQPNDGARP